MGDSYPVVYPIQQPIKIILRLSHRQLTEAETWRQTFIYVYKVILCATGDTSQ